MLYLFFNVGPDRVFRFSIMVGGETTRSTTPLRQSFYELRECLDMFVIDSFLMEQYRAATRGMMLLHLFSLSLSFFFFLFSVFLPSSSRSREHNV